MHITDIISLYEYQTPETRNFGQLVNMSNKAFDSLSDDAKWALDEWETGGWDVGKLNKAYNDSSSVIKEIQAAFAPVRAKMHELFGDTIKLHRGQRHFSDDELSKNRDLFSFSFDENVAQRFAQGRLSKVPSEEDIQKAVQQYERTGFVAFGNKKYKRNSEYPQYFNIYDKHNNFITDGDDLEDLLISDRQDAIDYNKSRESRGDVYTIDVPIDKIVWLTNRLNSKEFIVALNPLSK